MHKVIHCSWVKTHIQEDSWEVEFSLEKNTPDWKFPHEHFFLFWQIEEGIPAIFNIDYAYELVFEQLDFPEYEKNGILCLKQGQNEFLHTNWVIRHIRPYLTINSLLNQRVYSIEEGLLAPENVSILDLSHKQLTEIPEAILAFTNLERLLLHDNQLEVLAPFLFELTNLEQLDISHNNIQQIPSQIEQLESLRSFFLLGNQLESLPEEIGNLEKLEVLHLQHNEMKELPSNFKSLHALRELDLHDNKFKLLPSCLQELSQMRTLKIGVPNHFGNPLLTLPDWIGELKELEELALSKTKLTELPFSIKKLKKLRTLWVPPTIDSILTLDLKSALPNLTIFSY